jgi:hypothetical protein
MILFLDFDGVCHPNYIDAKAFSCNEQLWKILRARPDVLVVFSTSWRETHRPDELLNFATQGGGEDLAHRFVGQTPRIRACSDYEPCGLECKQWLDSNGHAATPWLALDDIRHQFHGGHPNLYVVDGSTGLTDADVEKIIARLKTKAKPV